MITRYQREREADDVRKWLSTINFFNANTLEVERNIFLALAQALKRKRWVRNPIAELAEPLALDDLVGDIIREIREELISQAVRADSIFDWISDTNNIAKSELESVESLVTQATDDIQHITLLLGEETQKFNWISDSFNNSTFVDLSKTTALIDTDYGEVTLSPISFTPITEWTIHLDKEQSKGIPGANMLVIDLETVGGIDKEPRVTGEADTSRDLSNLIDNDSMSFFEIERNFILPKQRVARLGRAFVYSESGNLETVREITKDLDWRVVVQWPDTEGFDLGPDGKGIPLCEFRDISFADKVPASQLAVQTDNTTARGSNWLYIKGLRDKQGQSTILRDIKRSIGRNDKTGTDGTEPNTFDPDTRARMVLKVKMVTPQTLTNLRILPMIRNNEIITVESIQVLADGVWIDVVSDVDLGSNKSATRLQKEILRRTGSQTVGSTFTIPTNRDVQEIRIHLSSAPLPAPKGLYHRFREKHEKIKTTTKIFGFSSSRTRYRWTRIPVSDTPAAVVSRNNPVKLLGSLAPDLAIMAGLAQTIGASIEAVLQRQAVMNQELIRALGGLAGGALGTGNVNLGSSLTAVGGALSQVFAKNTTLGQLGGFLSKAAPIVGGILAIDSLVGGLFGTKKTTTLLDTVDGADIFKGWRAGVAIRDLSLLKIVYGQVSVLQTVKRSFESPVTRVGLFVEEVIPESWGPGDWITYYISTDGQNWLTMPKLTDATLESAFVPDQPISEVYLLAILKGNPEDIHRSPTVKHYALQGLPL